MLFGFILTKKKSVWFARKCTHVVLDVHIKWQVNDTWNGLYVWQIPDRKEHLVWKSILSAGCSYSLLWPLVNNDQFI